jgi:hypothetical protein
MLVRTRMPLATLLTLSLGAATLPAATSPVWAQEEEQQPEAVHDPVWPRIVEGDGMTFTVYQPQIDRFDDTVLEARAAVQVEKQEGGNTRTSYGVVWITARTSIDKEAGLVELDDIQIPRVNFPTAGEKAAEYLAIFRRNAEPVRTISLARIEANLAASKLGQSVEAVPLKNDPPRIYYRTSPSILILIEGDPVLRPVEGSDLQRVLNTGVLMLFDSGSYYAPLGDRWIVAPALIGPWRLAPSVPAPVQSVRDAIAREQQSGIDLLSEPGDQVEELLAAGRAPDVIVSTVPAELIETRGKVQMTPIAGTQLLYASNTSGDILFDLRDQNYYVPLTGRWYRAPSLDGPWAFVEGDKLPADFAKIPEDSPKAGVLATIPGTPAAQEAVIANSIPQTAEVKRDEATFEATYDGAPEFQAVPDASLQYAVNTPTPVIRVSATSYYAVQGGVWFAAPAPAGPWVVATVVPPVIYTIPTACPIHYVTYVRIYRYDPTYVWVGYTPGYLGTCYSPWGTVVYGTGWRYRPWIGRYWYSPPLTWGFGVGIGWSPWAGWSVGFGWGGYRPIYRPYWGPYQGWHRPPGWHPRPAPYGRPPGVSITNINVYNRPGIARPGVRPVTRPAPRPAPQPAGRPGASTRPAPGRAARQAPSRPDNVYAGSDGNVYRPRPGGGWETNQNGSWKPVQPSTRPGPGSRPESRPAPGPEARPAPQPGARPARPSAPPPRPPNEASTLNQLSRDQRARQRADMRARPPQPAPRSTAPSRSAPKQPPPAREPKKR